MRDKQPGFGKLVFDLLATGGIISMAIELHYEPSGVVLWFASIVLVVTGLRWAANCICYMLTGEWIRTRD